MQYEPEATTLTLTLMSRTNDSNNTSTSDLDSRDENLAKIEVAIQGVIFILALVGNSCVLIALR